MADPNTTPLATFQAKGESIRAFANRHRLHAETVSRVLAQGFTVKPGLHAKLAAHGVTVELRRVSPHWRQAPMLGTPNAARAWGRNREVPHA